MLKLNEVINILENNMPFSLKEEWDNVGLMLGGGSAEIDNILVALDCTEDVVIEAVEKKADLIITHHPFIFGSLKNIDFNTPMGRKIKTLIKNDINVVSCHTNFDKAINGTSDTVANMLGLTDVKNLTNEEFSLGKIGVINPIKLKDFVTQVKDKLNVNGIKYVGDDDKIINKVAIVSGSGSDFYMDALNAGADVFITAEIKHHIAIDAVENSMALIDAGHFETENSSLKTFVKILRDKVSAIEVSEKYIKLFKTV